jgi:hypothetical protein
MQPITNWAAQSHSMPRMFRHFSSTVISLLLLCCFVAGQQAERPLTGIEEAYLTKDDGYGAAGEKTGVFRTTDVPIHCVVLLTRDQPQEVKINFIVVKVAGVRPATKVVSSSYRTKQGHSRVNFTGRPEGSWMPGVYRVDIFLEGKMLRSLEMMVQGAAAPASTESLVPRTEKRVLPRKPKNNPDQLGPGYSQN